MAKMFGVEHSKYFSASKADIWFECPGSIYLIDKVPPEDEKRKSPFAAEGSLAGKIAENILSDWLIKDMEIPQAYEAWKAEFPNEEMQDHILGYCLFCARLVMQQTSERVGIEKSFVMSRKYKSFGTADFCFSFIGKGGKKLLHVVDLKYGQGVEVDAAGNKQCAFYLCAADKDPDWGPFDAAAITIYQPRIESEYGPAKTVRFKRAELDWWHKEFKARMDTAWEMKESGKPYYKAGDHCRWCRGQAICKAFLDAHTDLPSVDFAEVVADEQLPPPTMLNDRQIVTLIKNRPILESWLKRVEEYGHNRMLSDRPIEGLKLVRGREPRKWNSEISEQELAERLHKRGVIDPWEKSLIGITKAEKVAGKGKINDLTVKPEGALKVVALDDGRPEVGTAASQARREFEREIER